MLSENGMERRLQVAGMLLILGLLVESLALVGHGAIAFLVFVGIGGMLIFLGVLAYLLALITHESGKN